ncbi:MAG: phage terminase small subunit P27 family, partial [Actinomycetota bacterium]|nr:phage terminase small subunit P27 family [Actinomycetota bacterium]
MNRPVPLERAQKRGNPGKRKLPEPPEGGVTRIPAVQCRGIGKAGRAEWVRIWTAEAEWLDLGSDINFIIRLCKVHDKLE